MIESFTNLACPKIYIKYYNFKMTYTPILLNFTRGLHKIPKRKVTYLWAGSLSDWCLESTKERKLPDVCVFIVYDDKKTTVQQKLRILIPIWKSRHCTHSASDHLTSQITHILYGRIKKSLSSMKHDFDNINPLDAGNAHSRCIYQPAKKV